jgi:hypothetical protein
MSKDHSNRSQGNILMAAGELLRHGIETYVPCHSQRTKSSADLVVYCTRNGRAEYVTIWVSMIEAYQPLRLSRVMGSEYADFLLINRRHRSVADEWFYLTVNQLKGMGDSTDPSKPILLPIKNHLVYCEQTLTALEKHLRGEGPAELTKLQDGEATVVDANAIQRLANRHVVHQLGDAIRVESPRLVKQVWVVSLLGPGGKVQLGELRFTKEGKLISEDSATYDSVREKFYAESSVRTAA